MIFIAYITFKMIIYNEEGEIIERECARKGKDFKKLVATIKPIKVSQIIENDIFLLKIRESTKKVINANTM